jgi:low affinity Fe/Cu permease
MERFRNLLTSLGSAGAHPAAFLTVIVYAAFWLVFERETFDWHGVATLATWMMTLFIQRSEHRDTQAIHGKLDELLRAVPGAENRLTRLDEAEPEDIEELRHSDDSRTP